MAQVIFYLSRGSCEILPNQAGTPKLFIQGRALSSSSESQRSSGDTHVSSLAVRPAVCRCAEGRSAPVAGLMTRAGIRCQVWGREQKRRVKENHMKFLKARWVSRLGDPHLSRLVFLGDSPVVLGLSARKFYTSHCPLPCSYYAHVCSKKHLI